MMIQENINKDDIHKLRTMKKCSNGLTDKVSLRAVQLSTKKTQKQMSFEARTTDRRIKSMYRIDVTIAEKFICIALIAAEKIKFHALTLRTN